MATGAELRQQIPEHLRADPNSKDDLAKAYSHAAIGGGSMLSGIAALYTNENGSYMQQQRRDKAGRDTIDRMIDASIQDLNNQIAEMDNQIAGHRENAAHALNVKQALEDGSLTTEDALKDEKTKSLIKEWEQRTGRKFDADAPDSEVLLAEIMGEINTYEGLTADKIQIQRDSTALARDEMMDIDTSDPVKAEVELKGVIDDHGARAATAALEGQAGTELASRTYGALEIGDDSSQDRMNAIFSVGSFADKEAPIEGQIEITSNFNIQVKTDVPDFSPAPKEDTPTSLPDFAAG